MDIIGINSLHLYCLVLYIVSSAGMLLGQNVHIRKTERLFSNSTMLIGRRVTCDNVRPSDGKFASDTWTCYNMRVDGLRVRYWYIPGFGADKGCSDGEEMYDSRNDIAELCRQMMLAHGIKSQLWVAFVNEASCMQSPDERVIFTIDKESFQWETFSRGNGYILTFRCMAAE